MMTIASVQLLAQEETEYGAKTIVHKMTSSEEKNYKLIITLPPEYNPKETYDVLYYLDAWWLSDLVRGSYGINLLANKIENLILVGISSIGDLDQWNLQRNMDFTPTPYDIEKMKISMDTGPHPVNEKTTGGGEKFASFLEARIFDYVESNYNVEKETRGLIGHSFGGLFGFYTMVNHNELFKNYILISPAVWWNKSELIAVKNLTMIDREANIFVVYGTDEAKFLKSPIVNMKNMLSEKSNLNVVFKEYEGTNHHSVLAPGIYDGIKELYQKK